MRDLAVAELDDEALRARAGALGLALRVDELRTIAQRLGRAPSLVELYAFDAQWSEHCSYKSSRALLSRLPTNGADVVLGPAEDAGILHLGVHEGERYGIVIAHESHNHPSQVVPFEGAATGIGGIVRDVLCMGAEVVAVADPLRFGNVDPAQAHQRAVARGVVDGIAAYGNAIGVPNLAGDCYFDADFDDNVLVNVVALGLVKESEIVHSRVPAAGADYVLLLVGKATDASGFGGASFSSVALDAQEAQSNKGAVQVPDPFLKNVIMRASYRVFSLLRERAIEVGFKDLGAGGIMGCSAELCSAGGFGAELDLDAVNVAVDHLLPEVIAVGETQERLLWALPEEIVDEVERIYNEEFSLPQVAQNARAVRIGRATTAQRYQLRHRGEIVMEVPIDFLTGTVRDTLPAQKPEPPRALRERDIACDRSLDDLLHETLAHRDVCSRAPIYRHYDGVVRGRTVIPRGEADAGVLAPIRGSRLAFALSVDGNPRIGRIDPERAAEHAVYESIRNVVAVGAEPIGLTDCLNYGSPRDEGQYGELVAGIDGLARAARGFGLAYVSGNVSLYNAASDGHAIPASPIVACLGRLTDVSQCVTLALKEVGSRLYLVGETQRALGGSVLAAILRLRDEGVPEIDTERIVAEHRFLLAAARAGLLRSAHDISDGGLLVTLAEMSFACYPAQRAAIGIELDGFAGWSSVGGYESLFGEWGGLVVEVAQRDLERFEELAGTLESVREIGTTIAEPLLAFEDEAWEIADLHRSWSRPLEELYP